MLIISNHESHIAFNHIDTAAKIDHVPAMVYRIGVDPDGRPILIKDRKNFDIPPKIYGDAVMYKDAIFKDFMETEGTVGAILSGIKGTGKTLTGELTANQFIAGDMPVIMVTSAWPASMIRAVIAVCGPCMIMFDEFGKVYDKDSRKSLLTLFSDSSLKKVMFIVTGNKAEELDEYMVRRPGRFKYFIQFGNADANTVRELAPDYKLTPSQLQLMIDYVTVSNITFDMLRFVMKEVAKTTDMVKLRKYISILNVDALPAVTYILKEVWIDDEKYNGNASFEKDEEGAFELQLLNEAYGVTAREFIDWDHAPKTLIPGNEDYWRVGITENITALVHREVSPVTTNRHKETRSEVKFVKVEEEANTPKEAAAE